MIASSRNAVTKNTSIENNHVYLYMIFSVAKENKKKSGIYIITSSKSEKFYIGSAVCLIKRFRRHLYELKHNHHHSKHLQSHYNKYGDVLTFKVLEICEREVLMKREQFYLDTLLPVFNNCKFANSVLGYKMTNEDKSKIRASKILSGTWNNGSPKVREKKKKVMPESAKKKLSIINKGKIFSDETKLKLSNALKGNKNGYGVKPSREKINKISEANKDKRRVLELDKDGNIIKIWNCQYDVYTELNLDKRNLSAVLHNKQKTINGKIFKFQP